MSAVADHGRPLVEEAGRLDGVERLGTDETAFLAANREHPTLFAAGLVDLDRGRLLDVVEDRCAASVSGWLAGMRRDWRDGISTVALDPHCGYLCAA